LLPYPSSRYVSRYGNIIINTVLEAKDERLATTYSAVKQFERDRASSHIVQEEAKRNNTTLITIIVTMPTTTRSSFKEQAQIRRGALLEAIMEGDLERVQALSGASCLQLDWEYDNYETLGFAPLHAAAQGGYLEILQLLLLKCGLDGALEDNAEAGGTPLQVACASNHFRTAQWLVVEQGANANADRESNTPLQHAARHGNLDMVQMLVREGGAVVDKKSIMYGSAVNMAARNGHLDVVQWLVSECHADWTFTASVWLSKIKQIIQPDGKVSFQISENMTPLEEARKNNHQDVVQFLESLEQ